MTYPDNVHRLQEHIRMLEDEVTAALHTISLLVTRCPHFKCRMREAAHDRHLDDEDECDHVEQGRRALPVPAVIEPSRLLRKSRKEP